MNYYVYIVRCNDETLYTGITNNLEKRILAHNTSKTGAKYTRSRRPVSLVYQELCNDKSHAQKREHEIKKYPKQKKLHLIVHYQ